MSHPVFRSHQQIVWPYDQSCPTSCDQHCRAGVLPSISLIFHPRDQEASWRTDGIISKQPESLSYGPKDSCPECCWTHTCCVKPLGFRPYLLPQHSLSPIVGLSCGMWDLAPWPGIEPWLPAMGAQSLSHWTTRELPHFFFTRLLLLLLLSRFSRVRLCATP